MRVFASTSATAVVPLRAVGRRQACISRLRRVHTLPRLHYSVENGLGNFMSPKALRTIAVDYQGGLLTRLNELVQDTELESQSVVQTVLSTARDPNRVLAFNMASQALNNSFFLDNLAPLEPSTENHEDKLPAPLQHAIKTEFGSLAQLKSNLSAAALGMMTSGWIWLVMDTGRRLAIVPTYGSGTVLVRSRQQMVPRHLAPSVERLPNSRPGSSELSSGPSSSSRLTSSPTTSSPTTPNPTSATHPFDRQGQTRKLGASVSNQNDTDKPAADSLFDASGNVGPRSSSASNALANSGYSLHPTTTGPLHHYGDKLSPLFCVSVHEHAWLHDYGVWGKEEYLTRFWNALDWGRVARLYYELGRNM